jgi:hypothetical protein
VTQSFIQPGLEAGGVSVPEEVQAYSFGVHS